MNISDKTVRKLLAENKKVTEAELVKLEQVAAHQKKSLQDTVLKRAVVTDEELAQWYAASADIPYIQLDPKKVDPSLLKLIPDTLDALIADQEQHAL